MAHATLIVTCSGGTYFDRDHYVDVHLPLALACWQRHGLVSASAFFPRDGNAADVSVGIYRFRDEDALHAALASAETEAVMADVPRFTDATVSRTLGTPLLSRQVRLGQSRLRTGAADQLPLFNPGTSTMTFSDRKVFVVGGSRGIGAAIVRRFAAAGATVVFTYAASAGAADQLAIETGAQALRADAGRRDELIAAVRDAGPIDIFVYNAGLLVFGDPLTLDADEVDRMIDVNVRGAYFGSVEASRLMPEGGRILIIGSDTADSMPFPGLAAYVLTKAAMQGMARGLARDLGPRDITINVIQPGPTDTDMNPADGPRAAGMLEPMAIKRYGTADEVASLTLYLAGTQARGITGAMHTIDGGFAA